jgi:hypothetical protein
MRVPAPSTVKELVLDNVFARRQNVHPVTLPVLDLAADAGHGPLEIDVGDQISEIRQRFADPVGGDGVDFFPLAVNQISAFQKMTLNMMRPGD